MNRLEPEISLDYLLSANVSSVWSAITVLDQMKKWYFDNIPEFNTDVGFTTEFVVVNDPRTFTHQWEITECIEQEKISYKWKFKEYDGESISHFELYPESDDVTRLRVRIEILKDFTDDISEFRRESCIGGWNYFVGDRLKNYLER